MVAPNVAKMIVNHDMIERLLPQCASPKLACVLDSMTGFSREMSFILRSGHSCTGRHFLMRLREI